MKIRQDMQAGQEFCDNLAVVLQGVLADLDSAIALEAAAKAPSRAAAGSTKSKDADAKKQAKQAKSKAMTESSVSMTPLATTQPKIRENPNAETVAEGTTCDELTCLDYSSPKYTLLSIS